MFRRFFILLASFALSLLHAAPVFETLADFEHPGENPSGRMLAHSDGNYYGTTVGGGAFDFGTVYKMTPAGTVTILVSFTGQAGAARGANPASGLTLGADGSLFGTTENGGAGDFGTVFKVTTAGVFTNLVEFTGTVGPKKGAVPNGLILHADTFFYGTTQAGGVNDCGTVFRMDAAGNFITRAELTGTLTQPRGFAPTGRLAVSGSTLYGTAQWGGANDFGTVFSVTTAGSWATLAEFTGISGTRKGSGPVGGVTLVGTTLFGTTETGGADDVGTIFKLGTGGGSFATIRQFTGADGAFPAGQLLAPGDGFLYGSTAGGGVDGEGTLFKVDAGATSYLVLASFSGESGAVPGSGPRAGLIVGLDGQLFGTTEAGGVARNGTVFKVTTLGEFTSLAAFTNTTGWNPIGAPLYSATGVVFPNQYGGVAGHGTVMQLSPVAAPVVQSAFSDAVGAPAGSLIEVLGTRFGISEDRRFFSVSDSSPPFAFATLSASICTGAEELADGLDGFLYGTSKFGGGSLKGAVFRLTPAGAVTLRATFTGANGEGPNAPLAFGADGIFGTTEKGGSANSGTVFKLAPDGALTTLFSFASTGLRRPTAGLVAGVDGNFYGTASLGGASDRGGVFRITPAGAVSVLMEFSGGDGSQPGRLIAAVDGTLYGCALLGGSSDCGTLFRVTPSGTFSSLIAFTGNTGTARGKGPEGKLGFGPGGTLYGVAPRGGTGGGGTAFRIAATGPHAGTKPATRLDAATLELSGVVQLGGETASVSFDFGPTAALGQATTAVSLAPSSEARESLSRNVSPPAPGQTLFFRARAVNPSGTSLGPILSYTSPTLISEWKLATLGDANAPDLGDPDGDGLATLAEYALGLHPLQPGVGPAPQRLVFAEGARLAMTIARDPAHSDVTIEVLAAPSISGPWTTVASSANGAPFAGPGYVGGEVAGASIRTVTIKDSAAANGEQQRFMRVRVLH